MRPVTASANERRRLSELFEELCRIESPSRSERACAERVIAELRGLGLEVYEDDAAIEAGSECGNLLARIPAQVGTHPGGSFGGEQTSPSAIAEERRAPSMLLCAHLDTVPPQAPVEPVLVDGGWENANEGILGADNKAAVAVLLVLARRILAEGAPVDVELLFTVCEERSLAGAHALDRARLRSEVGYVFDHASPIGEIVVASPCHFRLDIEFRGTAAHAGVRPEDGSSAILAAARAVADMPLGRIDAMTTANVGRIGGGSAINVVPERCTLAAEVRSLREETAEATVAEIVDCVHEAANLPDCDCDVDIGVQRTFSGYTVPASAPAVQAAELALRRCGYSPTRIFERRRIGRQCADRQGPYGREPGQRYRAPARARRAGQHGGARGHARSGTGAARRGGGTIRTRHAIASQPMLKLRRAIVVEVNPPGGPEQELAVVLVHASAQGPARTAIADVGLVGAAEVGDEVVVNVQARDLGLDSGGFDIVHVNLTRGLADEEDQDPAHPARPHVMKLNYTSLQHAVRPVEDAHVELPLTRPVGVLALHGQLAAVAWAFAQAAPERRLGYVQSEGGALPGSHSRVVGELRRRGLLAGHLTAGAAFGGEGEAVTVIGALHHGLHTLGWDAVVCGPGPGIIGSGSPLGHGGMTALDCAHAALALGAPTLLVARMSSGDLRERHRGISHHTLTVLDLLLEPVTVALPAGMRSPVGADLRAGLGSVFGIPAARPQLELNVDRPARIARHDWRHAKVDLPGYAASGLPAQTMGRGLTEDPLFFGAALAGGAALAKLLARDDERESQAEEAA